MSLFVAFRTLSKGTRDYSELLSDTPGLKKLRLEYVKSLFPRPQAQVSQIKSVEEGEEGWAQSMSPFLAFRPFPKVLGTTQKY